jgi:hypothetical protein
VDSGFFVTGLVLVVTFFFALVVVTLELVVFLVLFVELTTGLRTAAVTGTLRSCVTPGI